MPQVFNPPEQCDRCQSPRVWVDNGTAVFQCGTEMRLDDARVHRGPLCGRLVTYRMKLELPERD